MLQFDQPIVFLSFRKKVQDFLNIFQCFLELFRRQRRLEDFRFQIGRRILAASILKPLELGDFIKFVFVLLFFLVVPVFRLIKLTLDLPLHFLQLLYGLFLFGRHLVELFHILQGHLLSELVDICGEVLGLHEFALFDVERFDLSFDLADGLLKLAH